VIPVELIFNPAWWCRNYGISFEQPFYFDPAKRVENDVLMRRVLYERFGMGEPDPQPRPVIGSMYVAGGFVVPALFGVEVRFAADQAPCPVPKCISREEAMALTVPDFEQLWPMHQLIAGMDALEAEYGCLVGDLDLDGVLNTALQLRGEQFFVDLAEDPELVDHVCGVVAETQALVGAYLLRRTGSNSISVNRSIVNVDPRIYLHGNCSVQMVSPATFRRSLLKWELYLAEKLAPYGIHHCGNNLQRFAADYAKTGLVFADVGWGSDVAAVSAALPDTFLNLRLSPVRMLQSTAAEIREDAEKLLAACGRKEKVGLCCINMDHATPDENVLAMLDVARNFAFPPRPALF
jgi:uroporphyrinogen-III decarboxylase